MYQQNTLPFDTQRLGSQPMQFQFNNPPFIPHGLTVPPQIANYVPAICAACATQTSSEVMTRSDGGKIFFFNQIASNGYNNPAFKQLVDSAIGILAVRWVNRQINNIEDGIPAAARDAIMFCSALNYQLFPGLQQIVQPNLVQEAFGFIQNIGQIQRDVGVAINTLMQPQQPMQPQFPQQGFINNQVINNGYNTVIPQRPNVPIYNNGGPMPLNQGMHQQFGNNNVVHSSVFNQQPQSQPQQLTPTSQISTGRHDHLAAAVDKLKNTQQVSQPTIVIQPQPIIQEVRKELVWGQSAIQPHPLLVNKLFYKVVLEELSVLGKDKKIVVGSCKTLEKTEMDRARHELISTVRNASVGQKRIDSLYGNVLDRVRMSGRVKEALETEEVIDVATQEEAGYFSSIWLNENFLSNAVAETRLSMEVAMKGNSNCRSYSLNTLISEPIVGGDKADDIIKDISECKTWLDITDKLIEVRISSAYKNLVMSLDKIFTKEVKNILNNKLGIALEIDSFIDDIHSLDKYIEEDYGPLFSKSFAECQETFASRCLHPGVLENENGKVSTPVLYCEKSEDFQPVINYVTQAYTITLLQIHSTELGISLNNDVSSQLVENDVLWMLASDIFSSSEVESQDTGVLFNHHILVTLDNEYYEFHRSLVNEKFFTLSKFNL
jgi:hypothetical protein